MCRNDPLMLACSMLQYSKCFQMLNQHAQPADTEVASPTFANGKYTHPDAKAYPIRQQQSPVQQAPSTTQSDVLDSLSDDLRCFLLLPDRQTGKLPKGGSMRATDFLTSLR